MATSETPTSIEEIAVPPASEPTAPTAPAAEDESFGNLRVIRRNGKVTAFDANKITIAVTKAFLAVEGAAPPPRRGSMTWYATSPGRSPMPWCAATPTAARYISRTSRTRWNWR